MNNLAELVTRVFCLWKIGAAQCSYRYCLLIFKVDKVCVWGGLTAGIKGRFKQEVTTRQVRNVCMPFYDH